MWNRDEPLDVTGRHGVEGVSDLGTDGHGSARSALSALGRSRDLRGGLGGDALRGGGGEVEHEGELGEVPLLLTRVRQDLQRRLEERHADEAEGVAGGPEEHDERSAWEWRGMVAPTSRITQGPTGS